jgi:hypothetical protein
VRMPAGARVGKNCLIHLGASEQDIGSDVPSGRSIWPATPGESVSS